MLFVEHLAHPAELFLQADNCYKETKNRWVLAFCSWLVTRGVFQKVTLSFLLQGHTHEDVDQLFVGLAKKYTHSIIWTISDLLDLVASAYNTEDSRPAALWLPFVHDWKSYFQPNLLNIRGHSGPHVFVFAPNEHNQVVMMFKDYHSSIDLLRGGDVSEGIQVLAGIPAGVPQLQLPTLLQPADLEAIPKLFDMPGFPEDAQEWWTHFCNNNIEFESEVPDDYFDFEQWKLLDIPANTVHVPLPPSGFEIATTGFNGLPASEVHTNNHTNQA